MRAPNQTGRSLPLRWQPVVAIAAALGLVAASVGLGLRVPDSRTFRDFAEDPRTDYSLITRPAFRPLDTEFIDTVLGTQLSDLPRAHQRRDTRLASAELSFVGPPSSVEHPFVNDDMGQAAPIESIPYAARTNTGGAGREPGEPADCGGSGGTAWYTYRSARDEDVLAATFGTEYPVHLGVFRRSSDGEPRLVACDSDPTGNALVQFIAATDAEYLFQITAEATGGPLTFTLEPGGETSLVSRTATGAGSSADSVEPSISADGRIVTFASWATDLVAGTPAQGCFARRPPASPDVAYFGFSDTSSTSFCRRIYVADRDAQTMRLVSVSSRNEPSTGDSDMPSLSGNGHFVAFRSTADDLVEGDTNHATDIFVHDLATGRTERASISSNGDEAKSSPSTELFASSPSLSHDGRFVAFASNASNLVPGDTNNLVDAFVHDRVTRRTERVSVSSEGRQSELDPHAVTTSMLAQGNYGMGWDWGRLRPSISPDGRYVLFFSAADDLVRGDTNGVEDLFLHDRAAHTTELVSVSMTGGPADGPTSPPRSTVPQISADGRYVVMTSSASNLAPGDTYGAQDIFVRDRMRRKTVRVSVSSAGEQADQASFDGTISASGRYVVFLSNAKNLTPGTRSYSAGPVWDIFVHDLVTRTTTRVPAASTTGRMEARVQTPVVSSDGRVVAYSVWCFDFCDPAPSTQQVWATERPRKRS